MLAPDSECWSLPIWKERWLPSLARQAQGSLLWDLRVWPDGLVQKQLWFWILDTWVLLDTYKPQLPHLQNTFVNIQPLEGTGREGVTGRPSVVLLFLCIPFEMIMDSQVLKNRVVSRTHYFQWQQSTFKQDLTLHFKQTGVIQ